LIVGCIPVIPVAMKYLKDEDKVAVTMTVDGNAGDIYAASVSSQTKKFPNTQVIKDDRENLVFEGKRVEGEKEIWGIGTTEQVSEGKTGVKIQVKSEGMSEEALKTRAVNSVNSFCSGIGKTCKVK